MICLNTITYKVGNKVLLDQVSANIPSKGFTAILGNNGAGKSTLLNVLTGELTNYTGDYLLNNSSTRTFDILKWSEIRSVLPQLNQRNDNFIASEVIAMGALPFNCSDREVSKCMDDLISDLGISKIIHQPINQLSGGELQKIHLARVVLQAQLSPCAPSYIFLDEPANHLDLKSQYEIFHFLKKLVNTGFGIVAIIHDINLAAHFADHFILLKSGSVIKTGTLDHCLCEHSLEQTFDCPMQKVQNEGTPCPLFIPRLQSLKTAIH